MRIADRVLLDTNVLLAATDEGRVEHEKAAAALNDWPAAGTALYTSGQVLREYLSVATRPQDRNGLGLSQKDAVANVRALRSRIRLLEENLKVADRLLELLDRALCSGKQVHDANLVATALVHGVGSIVTINVADLARFAEEVSIIDLART